MLFKKCGTNIGQSENLKTRLQTPEGKTYEVSFVVAFVWEQLNGGKDQTQITQNLKEAGKFQDEDLAPIVEKIIVELKKVGLATRWPQVDKSTAK